MGLFNNIIERKTDGSSTKVIMTSSSLNMLERKILLIISIREGIKQTFYIATLIWETIK